MLGFFGTLPRLRQPHALLHKVAMGALDFIVTNVEQLADRAGFVELVLALAEIAPAPTHRGHIFECLRALQVSL